MDPIMTIGRMLRRGIIAFEEPTERVLPAHGPLIHSHSRHTSNINGVICGLCARYAVSEIKRIRLTLAVCHNCGWFQDRERSTIHDSTILELPEGWALAHPQDNVVVVVCPLCVCWCCNGWGREAQNMDQVQCHACGGKGTAEAAWAYDRGF